MSFPRYPSYKPSGVEWLGDVPSHWNVAPLKRNFLIIGGSTPRSDVENYWDGDIPWATPSDLSSTGIPTLSDTARNITSSGLASCGTTVVPAGSLLLSTRAPIGSIGIAGVPMCTNQGCRALVARNGFAPTFFAYVLAASVPALTTFGRGSTFLELSNESLGAFKIPVPPDAEQQAVAAFLDRETAKIDALVAEQERLIELLKEKRQAAISHAVTKGLSSQAPMKPSGIEWLGDIPEHWSVLPLKRVASVRTGVAKGKDHEGRATVSVPYLRVANVQDGYLDLDEVAVIDVPAGDVARYSLRPGDVLMNEGGDYDKLGRGHVWHGQISPCITQNHVFAVRPTGLRSDWLNAFTGSAAAQFYFMIRSKQSTNLASISSTNLMELPVTVPPDHEQAQILSELSERLGTLRALETEAQRSMEMLRERRSALVSAAVTGQIDVRGSAEAPAA